ncbi:MAG: Gfo/Idh/MocA family oxidoreductase, partial [Candidatus Brocadiia bacterium]|nr:Gfo/Idh/MocA family oxidoreductase [Candidatus Brocadiia bacterium]
MASSPINLGIVGCGGISRLYTSIYAGLADIANVVAMADLDEGLAGARRRAMAQSYTVEAARSRSLALDARDEKTRSRHAALADAAEASAVDVRTYRGYQELLADGEVEAIVLLTPPAVRGEPTIAAAESGRHVFTQGPMARSVEEADGMVEAVTRAGIKFHSQCGSRYARGMALAKLSVESGKLGKIGSARVELNWYRGQAYYRGWHGTWQGEGGGAAFHHGRYIIDPFLWVIGSLVTEVFAYSGPALRDIEHESLSQAVVRFENG